MHSQLHSSVMTRFMQKFYYDARDAVGTALSNIIQTGADMDSELQTAQETVEFNMGN